MDRLISDDIICSEFGIVAETLERWVQAGIVQRSQSEDTIGFTSDQVRRIWSIVSLSRDLDVNIEGIQIILELSDQIADLKMIVQQMSREIHQTRRLDRFHLRIIEERTGPAEWEIDIK